MTFTQKLARTLAGIATALAFGLSSFGALAQTCTPNTPRTDTGAGFTPFGVNEQVLARGGNNGPAWEWAVGTDTEGSQKTQGSLDWVSGKVYEWTITYSGSGSATLQIRDQGTLVLNLTYASGMDAGNALKFHVGTNPSIGSGTTIAATVTSINGNAISGTLSQTGNNQESGQDLYYFYPPMSGGFAAQGTVSLTYASLPTGGRVQFTAQAGTIACGGGNAPPSVSLTSPAANALYNAPANVTVSANATDSDGSIAQVQFFANGNPIGTASASPYSINWTNVAAGNYSLTAIATDNLGATNTSAAVSITVNAPPTVSITAPATNAVFAAQANIAVSANAADADGTIAQVQFFANGNPIGTATSAPYTINWASAAAGSYSLTAVATDNRGATAASAAVAIRVNAPPSVSLTSPTANQGFTAPAGITLTATASDSDGTLASVAFYQGTTLLATVTSSPYTFSLTGVAAGGYSYTAIATDNDGAQTTSAAVTVTVNARPSVSITAPTANAVFTAPAASISVTANATDSDGTITQVQFFANGNPIGTATTSPFTISWANVAAGNYSLTAIATDNLGATTTSAAVAVIVNTPPAVSITAPAGGALFNAPATISVSANATDSDGTIAQVQFFANGTPIGTATSAPFAVNWTNVAAGNYSLTAIATDNNNATTTSAAVNITVNTLPAVSITAPANNAVYQAPGNITVTAAANDADGTIAQVAFFANGTPIGTATTSPFTINWANVSEGSYSLTATATDNTGAATTSAAITVKINAGPAVSLTSPTSGASFTAPATINITAAATDTDGSITQVAFYNGATLLATVTSAPYTYTWTNVGQGSYVLTARATDNDGAVTTSAAVTITVNKPLAKLHFIHVDHLNTPRMIADDTQTTVWKWEQAEPFGASSPNQDPQSTGTTFDFPLRLPGQYFDRETSLNYNYYRDYDPSIGRYVESDLIGLAGGTLSPYLYVGNTPLSLRDFLGLAGGRGPFGGKSVFDMLIDFLTGESAKAISGAQGVGNTIGDKVCKSGGVPRGPLIDCSDCIRLFPEAETQEACFKGCRETIEKCKPNPQAQCPPSSRPTA